MSDINSHFEILSSIQQNTKMVQKKQPWYVFYLFVQNHQMHEFELFPFSVICNALCNKKQNILYSHLFLYLLFVPIKCRKCRLTTKNPDYQLAAQIPINKFSCTEIGIQRRNRSYFKALGMANFQYEFAKKSIVESQA